MKIYLHSFTGAQLCFLVCWFHLQEGAASRQREQVMQIHERKYSLFRVSADKRSGMKIKMAARYTVNGHILRSE